MGGIFIPEPLLLLMGEIDREPIRGRRGPGLGRIPAIVRRSNL
jgi:hypothetical protein